MEHSMIIALLVALGTIVTALVAVVSFVFGINKGVSQKIGGVYKRIDAERQNVEGKINEEKKRSDETYVERKVCGVLHMSLREDVKEIKNDVKTLLSKNEWGGQS